MEWDRTGWDDIKPAYQYSDIAGNEILARQQMLIQSNDSAVAERPYSVNDMASTNQDLGAEFMPGQLIDEPLTASKKWLIVGVIVVLAAVGYMIYKQTKKNKKY